MFGITVLSSTQRAVAVTYVRERYSDLDSACAAVPRVLHAWPNREVKVAVFVDHWHSWYWCGSGTTKPRSNYAVLLKKSAPLKTLQ